MNIKQKIITELEAIEAHYKVKVVYACESGSRAWGFPSRDSDYDVRFIYAHPRDWYLSINVEYKKDVIERPISDELDVSGWDLRKALHLFYKSNPPLLEWLGSPIVYLDKYGVARQMRGLALTYYNPVACSYHYLHMARNNYREYLKGEKVWVKKYFYVLRPLLAVIWLEQERGIVPAEFSVLVENVVDDPKVKEQIEALIAAKIAGQELDDGPRIPEIAEFIEKEFARLEGKRFDKKLKRQPVEPLNELFRAALTGIWGA